MKTIKWGMIGCGNVTEKKSGPGFYKARNSELYAVTNRTISKAYDYAKRHPVAKVYETPEEIFADKEIDAVYIATPPGSHKDYAIRCAEAGKACYIEKPMALDYKECQEIIATFEKNNVKGFVAYYRRRMPHFMKVKELIDGGAIGDLRFVSISLYRPVTEDEKNNCWRVDPAQSGGGIFMDMAVHILDALDYLIGEVEGVRAFTANQGGYYAPEDIVTLSLSFKGGVLGTGVWCFTAGQNKDEVELVGSKGRIKFQCFASGDVELENEQGKEIFSVGLPEHVQLNLIQSIVDEINGTDVCPSTLRSAARAAWVCEEVYMQKRRRG